MNDVRLSRGPKFPAAGPKHLKTRKPIPKIVFHGITSLHNFLLLTDNMP